MYLRNFLTGSFILVFCLQNLLANRKLAEQYISQYKDVAVAEMYRTGIPASIKLAQGLLESSWGQSDLATRANNHFGIKCGSGWDGGRFFKMDDDTDTMGNSVESCFRQFNSSHESYIAHSEFLTNPAKRSRYGFLFQYPTTDYVSWAKGLQFSGYATDKKYADKLINLVETYKLYQYDVMIAPSTVNDVFVSSENKKESLVVENNPPVVQANTMPKLEEKSSATQNHKKYKKKINGLVCVVAEKGETIESLAKKHKVNKHDIVIYNESKFYLDTPLQEGQLIYLESKKRFNEDFQYHVVKETESLFDIAQKYGIRVSSLASRNKIPEHAQLTKGIKLYINQIGNDHSYLREELVTEEFIDFGNLK